MLICALAILATTFACASANPGPGPEPPPRSSSCADATHPRPECTGVPSGTALADLPMDDEGNYTVDQPNTVLDGKRIRGSLLVEADGLVIRNSQIDGTVFNEFDGTSYSYEISDSTVGPETGCIGLPGLNYARYTATRVLVRGHDDGFRISSPGQVTVRDSYARLCYLPPELSPPDGSHSDGIQAYCPAAPCGDLTFTGNTVDARNVPATFMINLVDTNLIGNITIEDNLLAGGAFTIVTQWHSGPAWTIRGNSVVDGTWAYGPASGEDSCSGQVWQGNQVVVIDDEYRITSVVRPLDCET